MKKISIPLIAVLIITSCFTFAACSSDKQKSKESGDKMDIVRDAYVYTFPLMMMDATMTNFTNTEDIKSDSAPANWLTHADKLVDATFTDVVSPNRDTVYSQAYLDLNDGPMVFVKPKTDRFCSVEILDFWTNAIAILGSGGDTENKEVCVITTPAHEENLPANMPRIICPTEKAAILVRTMAYDDADMKNVKKIQDEMALMPLANYLSGEKYQPPAGTYDEGNTFVPSEHVLSLPPEEYFAQANKLMENNPPLADDLETMKKLFDIGVGPNEKFDVSALGENPDTAWKEMLSGLEEYLLKNSSSYSKDIGGWNFFGEPIAEFTTEYEYRALIALVGLLANPTDVAVYPSADVDINGDALTGKNEYIIHFEKDELPPTEKNGFWSITAYNSKRGFIDNDMDRYLVNDRSKYKFNDDGSLDIYLQSDKPEDASKVNNWLPTGDDSFSLIMRIYLPKETVKNGTWNAPSITKVH